MTGIDQLDLFSPEQRRERVVDWQVPASVAKVAMGLSGMDAMLGIRAGRLPPAEENGVTYLRIPVRFKEGERLS